MLNKMPFASTMPISKPMVKRINISASIPATVVRALDAMGINASAKACSMAAAGARPLPRRRSKAFISMME